MPISQKIDVYSSECHHYTVKHYDFWPFFKLQKMEFGQNKIS